MSRSLSATQRTKIREAYEKIEEADRLAREAYDLLDDESIFRMYSSQRSAVLSPFARVTDEVSAGKKSCLAMAQNMGAMV